MDCSSNDSVIVLGIDSLSNYPGAALLDYDKVLGVKAWRGNVPPHGGSATLDRARSGDRLFPLVAELLDETATATDAIDAVALTVGPGSFTGIRIGLAMVQGLFCGRNIPAVAINTLDAIEHAAAFDIAGMCGFEVRAVVQLRKTDWFVRMDGEIGLVDAAALLDTVAGSKVAAVGALPAGITDVADVVDLPAGLAEATARLGLEQLRDGKGSSLDKLEPLYLHRCYVA